MDSQESFVDYMKRASGWKKATGIEKIATAFIFVWAWTLLLPIALLAYWLKRLTRKPVT